MSESLMTLLVIFVLATLLGVEVIKKVPALLHTPLMSGSNAISGITVIGAMIVSGWGATRLAAVLGTIAVALAMINVVGGYLVTNRMLKMFQSKKDDEKKP